MHSFSFTIFQNSTLRLFRYFDVVNLSNKVFIAKSLLLVINKLKRDSSLLESSRLNVNTIMELLTHIAQQHIFK